MNNIPRGQYTLAKTEEHAILYRTGHPLAQAVCKDCLTKLTPVQLLSFDYTNHRSRIAVLDPLINTSGWVSLYKLTVKAFEEEEVLIFSGLTIEGENLDNELFKRMFSLRSEIADENLPIDPVAEKRMVENYESQKTQLIENITKRNFKYFEDELDKLDRWGDDKRNSLKVTLKDFDDRIKELKRDAKMARNLPEKLMFEKERKKIEGRRDEAWRDYDASAKEIDRLKDNLIEQIESRMEQKITVEKIFTVSWKLK